MCIYWLPNTQVLNLLSPRLDPSTHVYCVSRSCSVYFVSDILIFENNFFVQLLQTFSPFTDIIDKKGNIVSEFQMNQVFDIVIDLSVYNHRFEERIE